jgi:hypothetical protein
MQISSWGGEGGKHKTVGSGRSSGLLCPLCALSWALGLKKIKKKKKKKGKP